MMGQLLLNLIEIKLSLQIACSNGIQTLAVSEYGRLELKLPVKKILIEYINARIITL